MHSLSQKPKQLNIAKLERTHERKGFDCGKEKLNAYIQTLASQHEDRNIGRTFVMTATGETKVLGFYTLVASSVSFEHMPEGEKVPKYPVPVLKLAQLAVDQSMQGQGLGEFLLFDALARAERISREVAVFAVEVDALDDTVAAFYAKYEFTPLKNDKLHLYMSMKKIAKLGLND